MNALSFQWSLLSCALAFFVSQIFNSFSSVFSFTIWYKEQNSKRYYDRARAFLQSISCSIRVHGQPSLVFLFSGITERLIWNKKDKNEAGMETKSRFVNESAISFNTRPHRRWNSFNGSSITNQQELVNMAFIPEPLYPSLVDISLILGVNLLKGNSN